MKHSLFLYLYLFLFLIACQDSKPSKNQSKKDLPMVVDGMVKIPAGALEMGGDNAQADPNEFPKHKVVIDEFWMDETEVTNSAFAAFVKATNYQTVAERPIIWEELKKNLPSTNWPTCFPPKSKPLVEMDKRSRLATSPRSTK